MKRLLALLMAMMMLLALDACGEDTNTNFTDTSTTTESGAFSTGNKENATSTTESTTSNSIASATSKPTTNNSETTSTTSNNTTTENQYYNIAFKKNGETLSSYQLQKGEKIIIPSAGSNKWYLWDKQVPSTMPDSDLLFTATAIAGDAWASTTWEYDFNGNLTIRGTGQMSNYSENSQPWKDYKSEITTVKFDDTITGIGKYAFFGLKNLTSVVIPSNIKIIGSYSFANCTEIQSIVFGENVSYIGTQAFASSAHIASVKFLGTKTWFAKQGNYQNTITFHSNNNNSNANLFREYSSYTFSSKENWWPNY